MQPIMNSRNKEEPEWLRLKLEYLKTKIDLLLKVSDIVVSTIEDTIESANKEIIVIEDTIEPADKEIIVIEDTIESANKEIIVIEEPSTTTEESPDEKKRRKAKEYYSANKEKLRDAARRRYQAKKTQPIIENIGVNNSEVTDESSLVFETEPYLITHENDALRSERHTYYQNHLTEIRQYYQSNKDRILKRQQTEEAKAKFRQQYYVRRSNLTKEQIAAKNAIAVAQRNVRNAKLRAKYPGMKLKEAKLANAAEKTRHEVI
jgi:hypothetical protein